MVIVLYVTLSFIILRFLVTVFNFVSSPQLCKSNWVYDDFVSILIPARDEENNIKTLLESIHKQDYKNYEVIIYDDDSTDDTYAICTAFAATHPRFKVIKGTELPPGWIGKNHACDQLATEAKGKYLLFLDADEIINEGLINSAIHRIQRKNLALLTLFTNQKMETFAENTTVPLMHYMLLNLLPLRFVLLTRSSIIATACGQFMLFDAAIYQLNKWHSQVKNNIVEDAEIMKKIKTAKYNGDLLLSNGMITCRMYKSYNEAVNGFSKNFFAAFHYSFLVMVLFLIVFMGGPLLIIMTLNFKLIAFMTVLIILTRVMISLAVGQNVWKNLIFHPVQMINMIIISFLSARKHYTKTLIWKGRRI